MTFDTSKWEEISFGEIARSLTNAVKNPLSENLGRYVGLEHIEPGNIHIKSWGNVADGTTFTRVFRKGQVLFGKRRAYQKKAAVAEFDGICSGDILVLEAIEKSLSPELLPFIVQSDRFFDCAVKTSAGSLSPRTKFKDLGKFTFKLPPLDEQKRIADLLWSVDEVIGIYEKVYTQILSVRGSFLKEIYSCNNLKRKRLSELPISEISGMWKTEEKSNVIDVSIIRSTDMQDFGEITYQTAQKHTVKKSQFIEKDLILGDIIVERSGGGPDQPVGRVCFFDKEDGEYTFSNFTSVIRINDPKEIASKYLFYFLLFFYEMKGTDRLQKQTTGIRNLDYDLYRKVKIPIRTLKEQNEYLRKIEFVEKQRKNTEAQIVNAKLILKQIINQIFG